MLSSLIKKVLCTCTFPNHYREANEQLLYTLFLQKRLCFSSFLYKTALHCVKSVRIWSYSGLHFLALKLNTERYSVALRIQSECGKILTRITSFLSSVNFFYIFLHDTIHYFFTCALVSTSFNIFTYFVILLDYSLRCSKNDIHTKITFFRASLCITGLFIQLISWLILLTSLLLFDEMNSVKV